MARSTLDMLLKTRKEGDAIRGTSNDLKGLKDVTKGAKEETSSFSLANLGLKAALVGVALKVAAQLPVLVEQGTQYERINTALGIYVGSSRDAEEVTLAIQMTTDGAVDRMTAATAATRLFAMGLADSKDEAVELSDMAVTLGASLGQKAGPAIESFSLMLANQSIPRLDMYGLSAGKARTRINELMEANEDLSREQAFLQTVLEMGREKMEALEEGGFEAATGMDRLRAATADAKVEAGKFFKFIDDGAGTLADFIQVLTNPKTARANQEYYETRDAFKEIRQELLLSTDSYEELVGKVFETADAMGVLVQADAEAVIMRGELTWREEQAFFSLDKLENKYIGVTREQYNQQKAAIELGNTLERLDASMSKYILTQDDVGDGLGDMVLDTDEAKEALAALKLSIDIGLTEGLEKAREKIVELREEETKLIEGIDELESKSWLSAEQQQQLSDMKAELGDVRGEIDEVSAAWDRQTSRMIFNLAQQALAVDGFTTEEMTALAKLAGPEGFGLVDQAGQDLITTIGTAGRELAETGNINIFVENMEKAQGAVGDLDGVVGGLGDSIRNLPTEHMVHIGFNVDSYPGVSTNMGIAGGGPTPLKFADGGEFMVNGPYGTDRVPVSFMASNEEKVIIQTPEQQRNAAGGGSGTTVVQVILDGRVIQQSLAKGTRSQGVRR